MPRPILTRRHFLQGCSYAIASMAGARLTNLAFSEQNNPAEPMVVVFLRGGWDALNVVPPMDGDDRGYYEKARPDLKISDLLPLNDQFGLHPALAPLHGLYQEGRMGIVHAVGLDHDTRSHFDAQEFIELGTPGSKSTTSGWIKRYLQGVGSSSILPVLSTTGQPTSLLNFVPTVSLNTPSDFSQWDNGLVESQQKALRQMYSGDSLLHRAGSRTLDALNIVSPLVEQEYQPSNGATYNDDEFGQQLKTVAQMIKLETGLRVAAGIHTNMKPKAMAATSRNCLAILPPASQIFILTWIRDTQTFYLLWSSVNSGGGLYKTNPMARIMGMAV